MLVRRLNEPAQLWLHPQHFEIIASYRIAGDIFFRVPPAQSSARISVIAGYLTEGSVALPIVLKGGIGGCEQLAVSPRPEAKLVKIVRLAHIEGAQQHRIDYSKDDDIRPNPKHQSD